MFSQENLQTPLIRASFNGQLEVVKALLAAGANLEAMDIVGDLNSNGVRGGSEGVSEVGRCACMYGEGTPRSYETVHSLHPIVS